MADNVTLPGTGEIVATDDIGGVQYQQLTLVDSTPNSTTPVGTDSNPLPVNASYGELVEAMEALRMATNSLTKSIGFALPNLQGQPIFEARQATAANLNATVSGSLSTITTVSTVTNQAQMGGFASNDQIPALMHLQADSLRRNISVT
jgi:hypothetical protein